MFDSFNVFEKYKNTITLLALFISVMTSPKYIQLASPIVPEAIGVSSAHSAIAGMLSKPGFDLATGQDTDHLILSLVPEPILPSQLH